MPRRFRPRAAELLPAVFLLLAVPVATAADVTAVRVGDLSDGAVAPPPPRASGCVVGNPNPATVAVTNFYLFPPERFGLSFDPATTCGACNDFRVLAFRLMVAAWEPSTLDVSAWIAAAEYPAGPDCGHPGDPVCETPRGVVAIPEAGVWELTIPMDCGCLPAGEEHVLGITVHDFTGWPVLMTDSTPELCRNWDDIGWGWVDLRASDSQWPGNLVFVADTECCGATGIGATAPATGASLAISPNPFRDGVRLSLSLDGPAAVDLAVHDVSGRRVATLREGAMAAGRHELGWDGRDGAGRRVPAGAYFVRLVADGRTVTKKLVRLR